MSKPSTDSDAVRSAKPLAHAKYVTFEEPLALEKGFSLPRVTVCYETYGTLNGARDNAILICHALSGDSHVASRDAADDPGWWDLMVGPGKPIDTELYFVICPNNLGGCRGTTGPADIDPTSGKPYGGDFPVITTGDIVNLQRRLLDHLNIQVLRAAIGGSMGGHQVLTWATAHPQRLRGAVALATSPRLTDQALAFDIVGRNAILRDPHFHAGQYYANGQGPNVGLAVARMLAHITYLSLEAMTEKFARDRLHPRALETEFETQFSVGSYLAYQGHRFVERFDANSYVALTRAMDLFDLGATPEKLKATMGQSTCRWLVISFSSDWLFPPFQSEQLAHALLASNRPVTYAQVESACGHDAFLLANDIGQYGEMTRAFLKNIEVVSELPAGSAARVSEKAALKDGGNQHSETSIFHGDRLDFQTMLELIPARSSVLDLGCGPGALLGMLKEQGFRRLMGVECDPDSVLSCTRRGLDVIRADLNLGLPGFADKQFDVVILSQTLQTVRDVEKMLLDMLRVGKRCIVSFPNFGYAPIVEEILRTGHTPVSSKLLPHQWYNSPNIRFFTIADFEGFCRDRNIAIHESIAINTECGIRVTEEPNRNADLAIFTISR